jgi:UDP-N-acetylmuramoylalanine--D-glutamate ligase
MDVAGKKVVVVGMARSGMAAAEFLAARGAKVLVSDAKSATSLTSEIAQLRARKIDYEVGNNSVDSLLAADLIVVSPGVPLQIAPLQAAQAAGKPLIGEVELAARFLSGRLVGITGTNGKTTTTALIGELLTSAGFATQVGGNIGTPLINLVADSQPDTVTVVELSSFQLETTVDLRLNVAVWLNITPDHLDRYASFDDYYAAKKRLFLNQQNNDYAVLNYDDPLVKTMAAATPARTIYFSRLVELETGIFLRQGAMIYRSPDGQEQLLLTPAHDIKLAGNHNVENVMAAMAAGVALAADPVALRQGVRNFRAVEHRLELVAEIKGVQFYNDSKATNVDAAIKALEAFAGNLIVILGGKDKGSDYKVLRPLVQEKVKHVLLLGAASDKIAAALVNTCPLHQVSTMDDAVTTGLRLAQPGDIVLLAPACASFDMFDNFEHRGRVFKAAVTQLTNNC